MKKVLKVLLYLFVIFAIGMFAYGFILTRVTNFSVVGNTLLVLFSKGQYPEAYRLFSTNFKNKHSYQTFQVMVENSGLTDYKRASWTTDSVDSSKGVGHLAGEVTTKANRIIYLQIDFNRELDPDYNVSTWRINDLRVSHETSSEEYNKQEVPQ